nr:TonB-dependent receptor plug domain-containing protein [Candidatus Eremiobacteraeota bacterium]
SQAQAQRRVTGIVTGEGGIPLAAASIQIVGTQTATYTNESGRFSIQASDGTQTLRLRRIGYRARTVTLTPGQTDIGSIALARDVLQLETQVVTGTATSVSRANAANSVAQVSAEQLVGRAPAQTVDNALQGKIAGAIISTNSGAPGGGSQVQLRGVTSINSSSSPLYVVDGVLVSNESFGTGLNSLTSAGSPNGNGGISRSQDQRVDRTADLNPEDIESIEVLKGPSAGAIYGSKGANGVIVIRTKRGSGGRTQFNALQRVGAFRLQSNRKLPFRCFHSQAEVQGYLDNYASGQASDYGITSDNVPCYDQQNEFYNSDIKPSYQSGLSLNGSSNSGTNYRVGVLAQRDNAIQRGTYYQKQALSANVGQVVGKRLTIQASNEFTHTVTDRGISGNDNSPVVSPVSVFSNTPQFFNLTAKNATTGQYVINPFLPGATGGTNPFQSAQLIKQPEDVFRYIGALTGTYNVYSSDRQTFDVTALGGIDAFQDNASINSPPNVYFEPADGFPGTLVDGKTQSTYANFNVTGVHRYTASPFTATTSFGLRNEYRNSNQVITRGRTTPPGAQNVQLAAFLNTQQNRFRVYDLGLFAQEEFLTLGERLLITGAINAERSSVNGDSKKFYAYPKAAASYRLPITIPQTDEVKLRFAYGKAGNQPNFGLAYTSLPTVLYSNTLGAAISTFAGNAGIKPETSTEIEGGIDWNLFRGRLGFEGTLFRTNVRDLVLSANVAPSSGFTQRAINGAAFYKTGTELALNATPVQMRKFTWISRTTFATVNSRITQLDVPDFIGGSGFSQRYGVA